MKVPQTTPCSGATPPFFQFTATLFLHDEEDVQINPRACATKAFSLVELIVVMAIICILMGFIVPAFNGLGKSAQLNHSGEKVVNLVNLARQNSMSKNVMTALVVQTDPAQPTASHAFLLMELRPRSDGTAPTSSDWKPLSKWEALGNGTVVKELLSFQEEQPHPAFPILTQGSSEVSTYSHIVFLPGGNLLNDSRTPQIRLTEGFFPQGAPGPVFTRPDEDGQPLNVYNITILGTTGRTKIDRS